MNNSNNLIKNTEAEQSILGSILLDSTIVQELEQMLNEDMFYHEEH
ncbi:TPA: helicase, partial [Clostridioides difficile]|nr:helicase [Clostridioides difficile]